MNNFSLADNKPIPQIQFRECGPLTANIDRRQKTEEWWDSRYGYQNELEKECFQSYMFLGHFKYLAKRTASYKLLDGLQELGM